MSPVLFQGPCFAAGRATQCLCTEAPASDTPLYLHLLLPDDLRQFGELWSHVTKCLKRETSVNEPKAAEAESKLGRIPSLAGVSGPTDIIMSSS